MRSRYRFGALALLLTSILQGRALAAPPTENGGAEISELPTVNFVQPPIWTARPKVGQVAEVFPERAQRLGISGLALVSCLAGEDGSLASCSTDVEGPPGQGFGAAAVRLGAIFRLVPHNIDGRSIEGARVKIPIQFLTAGAQAKSYFKWESVPETTGPPAEANVATAISNVCVPYVLDGLDSATLPTNHVAAQDDGWRGLMFPQPDATVLRVGAAGFVHVAVYTAGDTRHCDVSAARADPGALRAAIRKLLAERAEGFSAARSRYSPGRFETEDLLCARPESAHAGGFARLSANSAKYAAGLAILFTLTNSPARMPLCDHEGVALEGRTLTLP